MAWRGGGCQGVANVPQGMLFEPNNSPAAGVSTPVNWFRAEGIPISPFDDAKNKNEYPLMRLVARNSANAVVATSDIVLPVSDEMDCRACHASSAGPAARPAAGWINDGNPERDYRLNILRLHDEKEFLLHPASYTAALGARGLNAAGLYANVAVNGRPVLCATCHKSEALQGSGLTGIPPLTASIHSLHATVMDPVMNLTLDHSANRAACYRCHPGSTTKCLRGAMGSAIAADGSMEMQCQSCHGSMSQVGSPNRVGWFMEPACQSCHTGTAAHNNGQIRYTSAFTDANGTVRVPVDPTFATTPNTPAAGLSLYRFSVGHGGLQCSACHGSTHAEFPSAYRNDNIRNVQLQGHAGVTAECTACHTTMPNTVNGGPHGMHPVGQAWVSQHPDAVEGVGRTQCQSCHGTDYRGTVLSLMQADRTVNGQNLFRGAIVGCYMCHNGPSGEDGSPGAAPTVSNVSAATAAGTPVAITLPAAGSGAVVRIISQAAHGSVGLNNRVATYFPDPGFVGADTFTFAAYNGSRNSTLATGTITVGAGGGTGGGTVAPNIITSPASQNVTVGATVTFSVVAGGTAPLSYQWQRNGVNLANGGNVSGTTTATLTLNNVSTGDTAHYQVVVSNGTPPPATSAYAVLTVNPAAFTIALTSPSNGDVFSPGANVRLTANVSLARGVVRVQFFDGGTLLGTDTSAPFSLTRQFRAGGHVLTARATNTSGTTVTSAPVQITVQAGEGGED